MPRHYHDQAPDDHARDQTAELPPTAWTGPRHAASDETSDATAEAVSDGLGAGFGAGFGAGLGTGFGAGPGTGFGAGPFDTTTDDADSTFVDTTTVDSTFVDTTSKHGASTRRPITVPHHAASTRVVSPRTVRVIAYVAGLALLIGGGAAFTFRNSSSSRHAAASRTDERASRDLARAPASLTPTPITTADAVLSPATTPTAPPTTPPAPAVTTTPTPVATQAPAETKPTLKTTTAASAAASGCSSYTGNRLIACNLLPSFGFATSQMSSLDPMWEHESGWNAKAQNASSGAYGIPQALPGSKMATAGSDWSTNPATQIKWGLDYIKQRYGSPAAAWSFWQANGWY